MEKVVALLKEIRDYTAIQTKDMLTKREAAMYMGLTEKTIDTHINEIRHYKPGKIVYFAKKDLDEYMRGNVVLSDKDLQHRALVYTSKNKSQCMI